MGKSLKLLRLFAFVPLIAGAAGVLAHEGDAVLTGEATVYENQADNNGGGGSQVCIGNLAITDTRRAFVRYNLPEIPAGSTIYRLVWEILQDEVSTEGGGPLAATLQVRRVTANWVEGSGSGGAAGPCAGGETVAGIDWSSQPSVSGADSATFALSADNSVNLVIDTANGNDALFADVQAWLDGEATNLGWRLAVVEEGTADNARVLVPGTLRIYWNVPIEDILFADGFE